jgi:predicted MFS family arabinose efflux permease
VAHSESRRGQQCAQRSASASAHAVQCQEGQGAPAGIMMPAAAAARTRPSQTLRPAATSPVQGMVADAAPLEAGLIDAADAYVLSNRDRRGAAWSVYLTGAIDAADAALLPAVFRALEVEMDLTPTTLAVLVLAQSLAGAIASPVWGQIVDGDEISRRSLLILGSLWWCVTTFLSAMSLGFWTLLLSRCLLGLALPLISPLAQSMLADLAPPEDRGKAFGYAAMWGVAGTMIGGIGGTSISNQSFLFLGVEFLGWRVVFLLGACGCAAAAAVVWTLCPEVPRTAAVRGETHSWHSRLRQVGTDRTWQLLTLQSLFGGLPFAGFHFLTLLMQYAGYSDGLAAFLLGCKRVGSMIGTLLGGYIGDEIEKMGYNRVCVAQFSVAWLLAGLLLLLHMLDRRATPMMIGSTYFFWGVGGSFCEVATDLPILVEVASVKGGDCRASMIAYKRAVQGVINPLGAPIAGILAEEWYGYRPAHTSIASLSTVHRDNNAAALSLALKTLAILCWPICLCGYSLVGQHYASVRAKQAVAKQ